ncbi:MAG: V-type ATP synthase subunit I [Clostridia bacterium]|nr:V-type ATP synthase subunit I [Clostridia bacterium]
MAIAVMRKLRVAAVSYEEDKILDALSKTGAVEIKPLDEEDAARPVSDLGAVSSRLEEAEGALKELVASSERYAKEHKKEFKTEKDGFLVTYEEFMTADGKREEAEELIEKIKSLASERARLNASLAALDKTILSATPYKDFEIPFSAFSNTPRVRIFLGMVENAAEELFSGLTEACVKIKGNAVLVLTLKEAEKETEEFLRGLDFALCPFLKEDGTGKELYARLNEEKKNLLEEIERNAEAEFALSENERFLKVYCDRIAYEVEKAESVSEKMLATERVILLEAYAPKGSEEEISEALSSVTDSAYFDFVEPEEDEMPPTLMQNNGLTKNFEAITNLYSPPNAKEFDPTTIMGIFYSVFLGFIMGDIGYGLFMLIGGGILWWKNRVKDNGLKRLAAVFAIGGVFAIIWGFLFNSLFGIGILPVRVMPPLLEGDTSWHILGIAIPALLVVALEIGVVQLFAGYVCRAVQAWRRGKVWDGILDGVVWAIFSIGVGLAIAGLVEELNMKMLAYVGGIAAGAMLLVSMLTAGRKEKLLGKFTKGFGAAYGIINYASDILSYARLYGLMLSGAVIAEIISGYALTGYGGGTGMIMSGNIGLIILGVVLLLVGHILNLALSLLGAYIHDARLQYVEFYGRFYEGEGELFAPLGSKHSHIFVVPKAQKSNR